MWRRCRTGQPPIILVFERLSCVNSGALREAGRAFLPCGTVQFWEELMSFFSDLPLPPASEDYKYTASWSALSACRQWCDLAAFILTCMRVWETLRWRNLYPQKAKPHNFTKTALTLRDKENLCMLYCEWHFSFLFISVPFACCTITFCFKQKVVMSKCIKIRLVLTQVIKCNYLGINLMLGMWFLK